LTGLNYVSMKGKTILQVRKNSRVPQASAKSLTSPVAKATGTLKDVP